MKPRRRSGELDPLLASLSALAHRLARLEARVAELERVGEQRASSLLFAWRRIEQLEHALRAAPPEPRSALAPRIPIARAAAILGTSRKHALRLAAEGLLDAADVRREGAPRAVVTVTAESLEKLLAARAGRPAPLDHENGAEAGRRRRDA